MLFVNNVTPQLGIYNPATGGWVRFANGRLEIEEDDPNYAVVLAEAERNPAISIHKKGVVCDDCGEQFFGKTGSAELGKHRKAVHFDKWLADKDAETAAERDIQLKSREGFACDVCQPVQTFPSAGALASHTRELHANAPTDAEVESDGGGTIDTDIPAATPPGG